MLMAWLYNAMSIDMFNGMNWVVKGGGLIEHSLGQPRLFNHNKSNIIKSASTNYTISLVISTD